MAAESSAVAPHGPRRSPKTMAPRHSSDTRRPVLPNSLLRTRPLKQTQYLDVKSVPAVRTIHYDGRMTPRRDRGTTGQGRSPSRDVRRAILDATEELLTTRRFDEIAVADVLAAAGVSRASFYFYFESKHAVLAELVRDAVGAGHQAARPWLEHPGGPSPAERLRQAVTHGEPRGGARRGGGGG